MVFSKRAGITPSPPAIQRERITPETRNRLWNALHIAYWASAGDTVRYSPLEGLIHRYWHQFFAWRLDELPSDTYEAVNTIRGQYDRFEWHRLLDFLEFTADNGPEAKQSSFRNMVNNVLRDDNSAYRFVGTEITEITSPAEVASIEEALSSTSALSGVNEHLRVALEHMSNRSSPDFRNSIKELTCPPTLRHLE